MSDIAFLADDRAIADALARLAERGEVAALATVVRVVGSAYRGVGARLLLPADGGALGMVSGGCLEADLAARAPEVLATGRATVVTYDTRSGDDLVWGLGLGCEGLVELLLEPLAPDDAASLARFFGAAHAVESTAVIATLAVAPAADAAGVGARVLVDDLGTLLAAHGAMPDALLDALRADARALLADLPPRARGTAREYALGGGTACVALEPVVPTLHLLLCGAGPDAAPLARLAMRQGWEVTVVDHRPLGALHASRFPGVRVVACADPAQLVELARVGPRTHAVVMSHHFERDLAHLASLLASDAPYVGLLGPRSRAERMLAEHRARVGPVDEAMRARVHGPAGLDLGGDGPEAIALAIVAEVLAVSSGRGGGALRDREAPIHGAGVGALTARR
ncbi:MAG TPA: XdhC family protein [Gemmatimonadaceae bacterium]|nr:XdhC family protein [Gemmatimonadaceae bacterium]